MITGWTSVKTLVMIMLVKLWWFKGYSVKTMTASDSSQIGIPLWCPGTLFSQDSATYSILCLPIQNYRQQGAMFIFFMSGNGFQVSWNTVSVVWDFPCNISLICFGEKRFLKISGKNFVIFLFKLTSRRDNWCYSKYEDQKPWATATRIFMFQICFLTFETF